MTSIALFIVAVRILFSVVLAACLVATVSHDDFEIRFTALILGGICSAFVIWSFSFPQ